MLDVVDKAQRNNASSALPLKEKVLFDSSLYWLLVDIFEEGQ